ncbi:hypothetical protein DFH28DRAFT_878214 [Melampsora americana]|nr:hypothetical protein DFH28DRAFT_878214 [Melampsora americana]
MSLSLLASRSIISTDRRHIDPNPDRLPINLNNLSTSNPTSTITTTTTPKPSSVSSSLLLLSTSAEAAVLESRKFERGSRPSSLQPILNTNQSSNQIQAQKQNSSISPPSHHHHSNGNTLSQQQQRLHHRSLETLTPLHHHLTSKRDHKHAHLFKCEKCPKVYRHPQCLVKHRWEHTSYWADASKLMLSKHQQVQMLEAAAILATPSGSLPESRSLWPAAVSPSEAGLLGSDQVNLDVIQSQAKSYKPADHQQHRSSSSPCSSVLTASTPTAIKMRNRGSEDIEMEEDEEDVETGDEEEEDEIMFEMSINGDDSQSASSNAETGSGSSGEKSSPGMMIKEDNNSRSLPITFSVSAPPPMGYFQPRPTTLTTTLVQDVKKPPTEPVSPFVAFPNSRTTSICSVSRSYYHPETVFNPPPYADSGLRFQDQSKLEANVNQVEEDEDEEDEDVGFGVREVGGLNGSGDEVIGMEL